MLIFSEEVVVFIIGSVGAISLAWVFVSSITPFVNTYEALRIYVMARKRVKTS